MDEVFHDTKGKLATKSEARGSLLDNRHDLLARSCRISLNVMSESKDSSRTARGHLSVRNCDCGESLASAISNLQLKAWLCRLLQSISDRLNNWVPLASHQKVPGHSLSPQCTAQHNQTVKLSAGHECFNVVRPVGKMEEGGAEQRNWAESYSWSGGGDHYLVTHAWKLYFPWWGPLVGSTFRSLLRSWWTLRWSTLVFSLIRASNTSSLSPPPPSNSWCDLKSKENHLDWKIPQLSQP